MTLPHSFRAAMGVTEGSMVELSLEKGKTVITPKLVVDGSQFPNADNEYTPAQRRIIDAGLAKSDADIKAGRVSQTFDSAQEFIADLHKASAKLSARKTKRSSR